MNATVPADANTSTQSNGSSNPDVESVTKGKSSLKKPGKNIKNFLRN